ncbi:TolB-like protein/tetratricopeptide (TPR) repeat protein [Mesorhizobium soli]|uniref:tetratricopeptide repeat protein n=1 Tax=Pseudaminobacter soli (ex Li et al. 2025) TaxID=1295366 RepID=UPI002473C69F|nr:tetratricopeptide repeat protein [Mesorhizobium soli]MDH6231799.1 TolB-like protein/tetratricopeptide (TPR) repeat protein [Mesorhizobium soli]
METDVSDVPNSMQELELRLLGPLQVWRGGAPLPLPPSRKVRALLAYLAVARGPVSREKLCDLLWDGPSDPRGELRWCLSRLRSALDTNDRRRVSAVDDQISVDLDGCVVDALRLSEAVRDGVEGLDLQELLVIASRCDGDFLEGIVIHNCAAFEHWLGSRRSEFRSYQLDIAAEIGRRTPVGSMEGLPAARRWIDLAILDTDANIRFLSELLHRRMVGECTRHLDMAARLFADEGLDFAPVRDAWEHLRHAAAQPTMAAVSERVQEPAQPIQPAAARRASVAIMPFRELGGGPQGRHELGSAVTHDVISRLARLRSLFVIARGSVFAVADEGLGPQEIGRRLGVDYVATGFIEQHEHAVCVTVEVAEAATSRIIWTEQFEARTAERLAILDEIGDGIVSSIAAEIENEERNRAILKPPDSLNAWEAYHRGLWHMYRFTPEENACAAEFFHLSTRLDPTFSRAYAGLSFTHWQRAFQRWNDREAETRNALKAAGQSLLVDDHNPAAHWSMGRALWLAGDHDEAVRELEQSVRLSPNFALGHYALAFVHSQSGDAAAAIASSDHSRQLSPCDPLLFGMLGTRALALVSLGAFEEAAQWGVKAAARPNAHVHIVAIAALCLALAGRIQEARNYAMRIRLQNPDYRVDNFLSTFRFAPDISVRYRKAAALIGMS